MYDVSVRAIDRAGSVGLADLSDPHTLGYTQPYRTFFYLTDQAGGLLRTITPPTLCSDQMSPRVVCRYEHSP